MSLFLRRILLAVIFTASTTAAAIAGPIFFNVVGASFVPGTGYGVDAGENSKDNPTLLDVRFANSGFSPLSFNLSLPSPNSMTFLFGTVDVQEPNTGGGILAAETDDLDVTANFTFIDPLGAMQNLTAVGTAVIGSVSDSHIDYTLTWEPPIIVPFGNGGSFQIALAPLAFTGMGSQNLNATITLLEAPDPGQVPVPEPATIALLGTGLVITSVLARRRRTTKKSA